jgi:hydroxybutyrate-dimer hydrolase
MDVYADCAGVDTNAVTPAPPGAARCSALKERGLLRATTLDAQVQEARDRIHAFGLLPDADKLLPPHASLHLWRILAPVYGSAYARASVGDHLCKTSFATAPSGSVQQWDRTAMQRAFGNGNGLPGLPADLALRPRGNIDIIDDAAEPPRNELQSPDLNLDGALCWRALSTGRAQPTTRLPSAAMQRAAQAGIAEVRAGGNLRGKPALILHGRKDALIAPNHSSRAYFGLNQSVEGAGSRARYIEITNGNHFRFVHSALPGAWCAGREARRHARLFQRRVGNDAAAPGRPDVPAVQPGVRRSGGNLPRSDPARDGGPHPVYKRSVGHTCRGNARRLQPLTRGRRCQRPGLSSARRLCLVRPG